MPMPRAWVRHLGLRTHTYIPTSQSLFMFKSFLYALTAPAVAVPDALLRSGPHRREVRRIPFPITFVWLATQARFSPLGTKPIICYKFFPSPPRESIMVLTHKIRNGLKLRGRLRVVVSLAFSTSEGHDR